MSYLSAQHREAMRRSRVLSKGVVEAVELADGAIYVDVALRPADVSVTAEYAPDAAGVFRIPAIGDTVLCGFVDGDFTDGFVLKHIPAAAATGAQNAAPGDLEEGVLYVWAPAGESVRVVATGGGVVTVEGDTIVCQSGDIRLGSDSASDKVVTQGKLDAKFDAFLDHYAAHQHLSAAPASPTTPIPSGVGSQLGAPDLSGSSSTTTSAE